MTPIAGKDKKKGAKAPPSSIENEPKSVPDQQYKRDLEQSQKHILYARIKSDYCNGIYLHVNGTPTGQIFWGPDHRTTIPVFHSFKIFPTKRGQGYGRKLLLKALKEPNTPRALFAKTENEKKMPQAKLVAFYESCGFKGEGREDALGRLFMKHESYSEATV